MHCVLSLNERPNKSNLCWEMGSSIGILKEIQAASIILFYCSACSSILMLKFLNSLSVQQNILLNCILPYCCHFQRSIRQVLGVAARNLNKRVSTHWETMIRLNSYNGLSISFRREA